MWSITPTVPLEHFSVGTQQASESIGVWTNMKGLWVLTYTVQLVHFPAYPKH